MISSAVRPPVEAELASRLLVDPTRYENLSALDFDPAFLVMPSQPIEVAPDERASCHGWYVGRGAVYRVVSLSYDKSKDNTVDGGPGLRRVIVVTGVAEKQTHGWQDPTTYVGGALIGHVQPDGAFTPSATMPQTIPVNNYSRMCMRGEVSADQRLSADPPQAV